MLIKKFGISVNPKHTREVIGQDGTKTKKYSQSSAISFSSSGRKRWGREQKKVSTDLN